MQIFLKKAYQILLITFTPAAFAFLLKKSAKAAFQSVLKRLV